MLRLVTEKQRMENECREQMAGLATSAMTSAMTSIHSKSPAAGAAPFHNSDNSVYLSHISHISWHWQQTKRTKSWATRVQGTGVAGVAGVAGNHKVV